MGSQCQTCYRSQQSQYQHCHLPTLKQLLRSPESLLHVNRTDDEERRMSDCELHYESDEYHEDSFRDLHRDDSLPDLVLSSSLKQKLGLTAWREFSQDLREGMKKLKESPTYQTVEAELSSLAIKKVSVKTSESLSSAQRKLTQKLQDIGVVDQPKIYRNDDIEPVIAPSKCGDN